MIKYSDKINILSMNGKIENDPSVLIRVKSARTFRVHFNFIALNFFFCDSKSNEREGLETRDFFFGLNIIDRHVYGVKCLEARLQCFQLCPPLPPVGTAIKDNPYGTFLTIF